MALLANVAFAALVTVLYAIGSTGRAATFAILLSTWSAALAAGALTGFIFGIPRYRAAAPPDASEQPENANGGSAKTKQRSPFLAANTNLGDVSDWLTKILLGAGLVQLGQLSGGLGDLGGWIGDSLPRAGGEPLAVGLVVHGAVVGFLAAFLWAATGARKEFEKIERDALKLSIHDPRAPGSGETDQEVVSISPDARPAVADEGLERTLELTQRAEIAEPRLLTADDYRALARRLKLAQRPAEAADFYLKAFQADPTDPRPLNLAGVLYSRDLGDHDRAAALYRQALLADPNYTAPVYNAACNEARRGDIGAGLTLLAAAITANPDRYRELARRDAEPGGPFEGLKDDSRFTGLVGPA